MEGKFFMVWGGHRTTPMVQHADLETATEEAKRLCQKHGTPFYVLQAVSVAQFQKPPVEVTTF